MSTISRVTLLAFLAVAAGFCGASAKVREPKLFLSWHAPYGMPRATDALVVACDDTAHADTLYLCFELGSLTPRLLAIAGSLYFYPVPGDTLGEFWFFDEETGSSGNFEFAPFPDVEVEAPWGRWGEPGEPEVTYHHISGNARLDLPFVVPTSSTLGLEADRRYCYARVTIHRRRPGLPGCRQPVCVRWASARLRFATGRVIEIRGGSPLATWNSPDGGACAKRRGNPLVKPWRPKSGGTTAGGN